MEKETETPSVERTFLEGILHYLSTIIKYKKMILINTTIAALVIVVFSILTLKLPVEASPLPNEYQAYAVVLFKDDNSNSSMSGMLSAFGIESSGVSSSPAQLALEIMRSRSFLDKVVEEFNIDEMLGLKRDVIAVSREFILKNSSYRINKDTGSLTISFTYYDPKLAADIVNYEIDLIQKWFLEKGVSTRTQEISLMEEKIKELDREMSEIENQIKVFQYEYGVIDISELAIAQSTMLTDLRTSLNQIELEIKDYTGYSTIEDPALTMLKNKQQNIILQIKNIENGYVSSDGRRMPSQKELPELSLEFAHLTSDLSLKSQLMETLSERYEVAKLIAAEESAFSVLEMAEIPQKKIGPSRGNLCITFTMGAFIISIALALSIDIFKKIISNPKNRQILAGEA